MSDNAKVTITREQADDLLGRLQGALSRCAGAGEWERVATADVTDVGSSISMPVGASRGTHVLTVSGVQIHVGDRVTVDRRRTPGGEQR